MFTGGSVSSSAVSSISGPSWRRKGRWGHKQDAVRSVPVFIGPPTNIATGRYPRCGLGREGWGGVKSVSANNQWPHLPRPQMTWVGVWGGITWSQGPSPAGIDHRLVSAQRSRHLSGRGSCVVNVISCSKAGVTETQMTSSPARSVDNRSGEDRMY